MTTFLIKRSLERPFFFAVTTVRRDILARPGHLPDGVCFLQVLS
jgi:hypothetical protein